MKKELSSLSKRELTKKEQSAIKGGCIFCMCGCVYSPSGGDSTGSSDSARDGGSWY